MLSFILPLFSISSPTDTTTGEILMSGRHVMMGYMGSEERTAETVVDSEEGWLRYVHRHVLSKLQTISKFLLGLIQNL